MGEDDGRQGPFEGLRVVEVGRFIAVPYCGQLFADGGADVIKVEPLAGDESRINTPLAPGEGRQFLNKNRGKRSVALELSDRAVQEVLARLIAGADVVLLNLRPGQAEEYGIGWEQMHARNPRLIYADITAFGREGPDAGLPGMDAIAQPRAGLAAALGVVRDGAPAPAPLPLTDYGGALLLAWGVVTALYVRERTGKGQRVQTSLLAAALVLQNNVITRLDERDGWLDGFFEWLSVARRDGTPYEEQLAQRLKSRPVGGLGAVYARCYRTADGFLALAAGTEQLRQRAITALGIDDPRLTDPTFHPADPHAYIEEQAARIQGALIEDGTATWIARLRGAGVPCADVRLPEELYDDPQVLANGLMVTLHHPTLGPVRVVAPPVQLSATPLAARRPPPRLGEHTHEVLAEAGLDAATSEHFVERGVAVALNRADSASPHVR